MTDTDAMYHYAHEIAKRDARIRELENALRNMCHGCDGATVFPCLACQLVTRKS